LHFPLIAHQIVTCLVMQDKTGQVLLAAACHVHGVTVY